MRRWRRRSERRRVVELQFLGMDAAGDEERGQAECPGAGDVGADGVADREHARRLDLPAERLRRRFERHLVDRPVRLAGVEDLAAHLLVGKRDRAGAGDELAAALNQEVRIGAQHPKLALAHAGERRPVILGGLAGVVEQARADDVVGVLEVAEAQVEAGEDRLVALRADVMHDLVLALADDAPRQVAGGDDAVIGPARHGEPVELADDGAPRPRRVGDQDRSAAPVPEARQGLAGLLRGLDAVVDHAPDVAEDHVVAGRDLLEARDEADGFGLLRGHGDRGFWREPRRYGPTRAKSTRGVQLARRRNERKGRFCGSSAGSGGMSAAADWAGADWTGAAATGGATGEVSTSARTGRGGENTKPWASGTSRSRRSGTSSACSTRSAMSLMPARDSTAARSCSSTSSPCGASAARSISAGSLTKRTPRSASESGSRRRSVARSSAKTRPRSRSCASAPALSASSVRQQRCDSSSTSRPVRSGWASTSRLTARRKPGSASEAEARLQAMRASLPRAARWRAMAAERASTLRSRSGMSPRRSSTGRNSAGTRSVPSSSRSRARAS